MNKYLLLLLVACWASTAHAQKAMVKKGDALYKQMAYPEAITYYLKALKKDSSQQEVIFRLADCYRLTNNRQMSEKWYAKAVEMPAVLPIHKFYYGQALMNNGKFAQAKKWMTDFVVDNKDDGRGQSFLRAIDNYQRFFADSANYTVSKLDINSGHADFGAAIFQEGIVFASSRKTGSMIERKHSWTNQPFLDLYYSRGTDNRFRSPEHFSTTVHSKLNDGPVSFNKKGDEMWLTRNSQESNKKDKNGVKTFRLKLYKALAKGGNEWSALEPFPYNSDQYSCAHAALSPDGQLLYFASDMPGGRGGMDLFVCTRQGNGWSRPVNLGDTVNTRGNEVFPAVMEDGTLYYSSDGLAGLGGLDIFYTRNLGERYTIPMNLGYPLNTYDDDFGMVYDAKNKVGYLSSNRDKKGFDDDIYTFRKKTIRIKGIVVNKENGKPIQGARVELRSGEETNSFITLENGRFEFPAAYDRQYTIKGMAEAIGDSTIRFETMAAYPGDPFIRIELGEKTSSHSLSIEIVDAETKEPIPGAMIRDEDNGRDIGSSDLDGRYTQPIVPQKDEQLLVYMEGYRPKLVVLKGQQSESPSNHVYRIEMQRAGTVSPYESWFKMVYYDLDKSDIREDAAKTLDEVAIFLREHPYVKISISSSTDSRASKEYNERLSQNRSRSARQYLMDKGVNSRQLDRITWTGESVLVNDCSDAHPCTEEMHQLNRRTELMVIEVKRD